MIKINKKLLAILIAAAVLLGAGAVIVMAGNGVGGTALLSSEAYSEYKTYMNRYDKLNTILEYVEQNYYADVDEENLLDGAYSGLVAGLGDRYSEYIPEDMVDSFYQDMSGKFYGIGMTFNENADGECEVVSCYIDSPAEKGGIKSGDIVVSVDGVSVVGLSTLEIRDMIRGEDGTVVELTLRRGEEEYSVSMTRQEFDEQTVSYNMLEDNIGYIYIASFVDSTPEEFARALKEIEENNAIGLIIDLRYNGGGFVDSACEIADMLMDNGTIAYALAKDGSKEVYTTQDGRTSLNYVLLVNGYTASAAEILTIGIQDNNEGYIVGEQTYGKGVIQITYGMNDGSAIKLTFMEYFSPSGQKIHGVGITPDYVVELTFEDTEDTQINKAIELIKAGGN